MKKAKIILFYTELADYTLSCIAALNKHAEVLVVHWPINKEAPFQFHFPLGVVFLEKKKESLASIRQQCMDFKPSAIVCSGWVDKNYLGWITAIACSGPVVLMLDNHWKGSLKQKLSVLFARLAFRKLFSHVWIPGVPQMEFAKQLGFSKENILTGVYCCDTNRFNNLFEAVYPLKKAHFPKRFLYVGRYTTHKGIFQMWQAFTSLQEEMKTDWEMVCVGTGDQYQNRVIHPRIKHYGFLQPDQMREPILQTGVFILPSFFEPWGVVVHEMAACGYPLLCSSQVGAASQFVKSDNGWVYSGLAELKKAMKNIMSKTDHQLWAMGKNSHLLAQENTPTIWAQKILSRISE